MRLASSRHRPCGNRCRRRCSRGEMCCWVIILISSCRFRDREEEGVGVSGWAEVVGSGGCRRRCRPLVRMEDDIPARRFRRHVWAVENSGDFASGLPCWLPYDDKSNSTFDFVLSFFPPMTYELN
jgi:hypothetical protein